MSSETVTRNDLTAILNEVLPNPSDMTPQEVEDFVDGLNISGINAVDYVVEQGTSGIWTYRKWNSGIAECWGNPTTESVTFSSAGSGTGLYQSVDMSVALPFTFTSISAININAYAVAGDYGWVTRTTQSSLSQVVYRAFKRNNTTGSVTTYISVMGTWK